MIKSMKDSDLMHERVFTRSILMKILAIILIFSFCGIMSACSESEFELQGKWKNIGTEGFGQAQPGSIVVFDGAHCNLYSPADTYAFYMDNGKYVLEINGLLGGNFSFTIEVLNKDNIRMSRDGKAIEFRRVQ